MPKRPESALEQLDAALGHVADCLAGLTEAQWDELCEQEARDLQATLQYFAVEEVGDRFPPATVLGNRIIALFAARYPLLATDGDGTA
jgi:hypothetical protein